MSRWKRCTVRFAKQRIGRERCERFDAVRANLACLVRRFGQDIPGGHPVLTWLVKYSVAMVNRCRRGPDGKTAYELRKGRKFA